MKLISLITLAAVTLQQVPTSFALKCELVPLIIDQGAHDIFDFACQHGDRMLAIDNHLEEFDEFLKSPHAVNPGFDLDFAGAEIRNHTFYIPANATMFYDSFKVDNGEGREGGPSRKARRHRERRLGGANPAGDQYVLVLYVTDSAGNAPDFVPDGEADSLEDDIFGTYGDPVFLGERVSEMKQTLKKVFFDSRAFPICVNSPITLFV